MSCLSTIIVSFFLDDADDDASTVDSNRTCCSFDNTTIDFITSFGLLKVV